MDYKSLILEISSILIVNFSFYPYSKFQLVSGTDRIPCLECIRHIDRQIHLYLIQILPPDCRIPSPLLPGATRYSCRNCSYSCVCCRYRSICLANSWARHQRILQR